MKPHKILPWAIFLLAIVYYLSYFRYGISLLDEGYNLDPPRRILAGEVPYRDFYHFYAPLPFYLLAGLFKLFGPSLLLARGCWLFFLALAAHLIFLVSRRLTSDRLALIPTLLFLVSPGPWHKWFFVLSAMSHLWLFGRLIESRLAPRWLLAAGLLTGVILFTRQDIGVFAFLCYHIILLGGHFIPSWPRPGLKGWGKNIGLFYGGILMILLPCSLFFWLQGAFLPMVWQLLLAGWQGTSANTIPFPAFWGSLKLYCGGQLTILGLWTNLIHYFPPSLYGLTSLWAGWIIFQRQQLRPRQLAIISLTIFGLMLFHQDLRRSYTPHLLQAIPSAYILLAVWLQRLAQMPLFVRIGRLWGSILMVGATLLMALFLIIINPRDFTHSILSRLHKNTEFNHPQAKVILAHDQAVILTELLEFLAQKNPDKKPILAIPDIPMIYFLHGPTCPIFFELLRPGRLRSVAEEDELIQNIDGQHIKIIILNQDQATEGFPERRLEKHAPRLFRYILRHYEMARQIGPYTVFMKNSD